MWRDVIEVGQVSETITSGEPIKTTTYTTVFANKKSVGQKEFYESRLAGLKPEIVFQIRSIDYAGHDRVRFDSAVYEIVRTYDKGEIIELYCQKHTGAGI